MAIAGYKVDATLPTQPNVPKIEPEVFKGVVNDDKVTPINSLIAYISGSTWSVDYYSQIVSKHNDLRELDINQSGVYQQYQKTIGLEIRVNNPLSSSYNTELAITTVNGAGILYPFITPNISDYFISDTADNNKALFRITTVDRRTFNRDAVFAIEYELVAYISAKPEMFSNLESKTIRQYFFSKERLVEGLPPILTTEDHRDLINIKASYKDLVAYYFRTFFNRKYSTLVMPGQSYVFYDHLMLTYLLSIVDTFDAYEIRNIRLIPTDNDQYLAQPQFWLAMANRDYDMLSMCNQKMGLINSKIYNKNPWLQGLAFQNIDYCVYPINPDTSSNVENNSDVNFTSLVDIVDVRNVNGNLVDILTQTYVTEAKTFPIANKILVDDYYVLSESFYKNESDMSVIEILTKDYLKGNTLDIKMLTALITRVKQWGRLEQFYYVPIILTLLKEADRATYS